MTFPTFLIGFLSFIAIIGILSKLLSKQDPDTWEIYQDDFSGKFVARKGKQIMSPFDTIEDAIKAIKEIKDKKQ